MSKSWGRILRFATAATVLLLWTVAIGSLSLLRGIKAFVILPPVNTAFDASIQMHKVFSRTRLYGIKVTIRIVGRKGGGEKWIEDGCDMYVKRLKPANVDLVTEWHKSNEALIKGIESDWSKNFPVVLLDPKGKKFSSETFSAEFYRLAEDGGSRLVYVIGGVSLGESLASG